MQSSELWAAWIVAALMVGLVAWVGHIEPRQDGLTPASEVARRAPVSPTRPPGDGEVLPAMQRGGPSLPALHPAGPSSSGRSPQVYLCVIEGPQHAEGMC